MLKLENQKVAQLGQQVLVWEEWAMDQEGRVIDKDAYKMWQVLTREMNRSACLADELSQEISEEMGEKR